MAEPPFYPYSGTAEERDEVSPILHGEVYLTNYRGAGSAQQMNRLRISHILSVGAEFVGERPLAKRGIEYQHIEVHDDEEQADTLAASLEDACAYIDAALKGPKRGRVCVHCAAGISRSTTVVLAYMIMRRRMALRESFERAYARRRVVWPNDGFMRALIQLEESVRGHSEGKATISLPEYTKWGDFDHDAYVAARLVDREGPDRRGQSQPPSEAVARAATPPGWDDGNSSRVGDDSSRVGDDSSHLEAAETAEDHGTIAARLSAVGLDGAPSKSPAPMQHKAGPGKACTPSHPSPGVTPGAGPAARPGFQRAIAPRLTVRVTDVQANYKTAVAAGGTDVLYIRKTSMRSRDQWAALKIGDELDIAI